MIDLETMNPDKKSSKNYWKMVVYSYRILLETPRNKTMKKLHLHSLKKCHKIINSKELFNIIQMVKGPTEYFEYVYYVWKLIFY